MYDHGDDDDNNGAGEEDASAGGGTTRKKCKFHAKPLVPSKCSSTVS